MNKYSSLYLNHFSSKIATQEQSMLGSIKNKIKELFTVPDHGNFAASPRSYLRRVEAVEKAKQPSASIASN